jgi:hypothetical protein
MLFGVFSAELYQAQHLHAIVDQVSFFVRNRLTAVSRKQFIDTVSELDIAMRLKRPTISAQVLLMSDSADYEGLDLPGQRSRYALEELTRPLWEASYRTQYVISDAAESEYLFMISRESRAPERLFFYGQKLDDAGLSVLDAFKQKWPGRVGDYGGPGRFIVEQVLRTIAPVPVVRKPRLYLVKD